MTSVAFKDCTAGSGGGVAVKNGLNVMLSNVSFVRCSAEAGTPLGGGGLFVESSSDIIVEDSRFEACRADRTRLDVGRQHGVQQRHAALFDRRVVAVAPK